MCTHNIRDLVYGIRVSVYRTTRVRVARTRAPPPGVVVRHGEKRKLFEIRVFLAEKRMQIVKLDFKITKIIRARDVASLLRVYIPKTLPYYRSRLVYLYRLYTNTYVIYYVYATHQ